MAAGTPGQIIAALFDMAIDRILLKVETTVQTSIHEEMERFSTLVNIPGSVDEKVESMVSTLREMISRERQTINHLGDNLQANHEQQIALAQATAKIMESVQGIEMKTTQIAQKTIDTTIPTTELITRISLKESPIPKESPSVDVEKPPKPHPQPLRSPPQSQPQRKSKPRRCSLFTL